LHSATNLLATNSSATLSVPWRPLNMSNSAYSITQRSKPTSERQITLWTRCSVYTDDIKLIP